MKKPQLIIAILVVALIGAGYYIYQEQQKESVSINIGDKQLSIETD